MVGFGRKPAVPAVAFSYDSIDTAPEYAPLREAVRQDDWTRAETALAALPADEASYAISDLGNLAGVEAFLERAVASHPDSPWASTALAMRYVVIGWSVRGDATSEHVSAAQFQTFHEWAGRAEQLLIEVGARHPSFAPSRSMRVLTSRALEVDGAEAQRRYRDAAALSPHDLFAQAHRLQYLCPKWFGSVAAAEAFARDAAAAAPPGSHAGAVIALWHLEQWLSLGGGRRGKKYLRQADVVGELRSAARRSVLDPAHRGGPMGVHAHSAFAMAFWLGGHLADAAAHVRAADGRASEYPWNYALDDASGFARVRDDILRAAGG